MSTGTQLGRGSALVRTVRGNDSVTLVCQESVEWFRWMCVYVCTCTLCALVRCSLCVQVTFPSCPVCTYVRMCVCPPSLHADDLQAEVASLKVQMDALNQEKDIDLRRIEELIGQSARLELANKAL